MDVSMVNGTLARAIGSECRACLGFCMASKCGQLFPIGSTEIRERRSAGLAVVHVPSDTIATS